MSTKPKVIYFPIQGRAEAVRLALAAAGVEFENETVTREELKSDFDKYHFGQVPRFVDDQVDICQSVAILRHIGRKHGLYGATIVEQAQVDEVIEGGVDLANAFVRKYALKKEDPEARETYWREHWDPDTATAPSAAGAHAAYLSRLLSRGARSGYFVASGLTIADIHITVMLGIQMLVYGHDRVAQQWPELVALHDRVLALPKVADYLTSPLRYPVVSPFVQQLLQQQEQQKH